MAWLTGWGKRKTITIDHTKVPESLSDFPVLVSISADTDIGASALSTGYDIRFAADDETTLLNYERESFTITEGSCTGIFWVKIPTLSTLVDTVIYLYYGKADATDGENKTAVWDSNFKGVWHLNQDPSGTAPQITDSTSTEINGTTAGTMASNQLVAAKISNGLSFDGSNDCIIFGSNAGLSSSTGFTYSMWFKRPVNGAYRGLIEYLNGGHQTSRVLIDTSNQIVVQNEGTDVITSAATSQDVFYHMVITWAGNNTTPLLYLQGSLSVTGTECTIATGTNDLYVGVGAVFSPNYFFNGVIDEFRFSNIARSPGWISTEYANQNSPSTFYSVSAEEEDSIPAPVANFAADVVTGTHPLTVTFTDLSTNTTTSWAWNFGDGSTSAVQNPSHQYLFPGTYKVVLTATNESGSDTETKIDYIEVTPTADTIFIIREKIEMDHKVGTTAKHIFRVAASNGSGYKSTCTNPVILCSQNGADETTETWTISAFSATMNRFTLNVVDPGTWAVGDNIEIVVYCDEGAATLHLNIVSDSVEVDTTGLATSAELSDVSADTTAIKAITDLLTADPLAAIKTQAASAISEAGLATAAGINGLNNLSEDQVLAQVASALGTYDAPTKAELDSAVSPLATSAAISALNNLASSDVVTACGTALNSYDAPTKAEMDLAFATTDAGVAAITLSESVGAEKVIPAAYYQLNAAAKTITLLTPYNTVTVEQIISIFNLTKGCEIYNCLSPRKRRKGEDGMDIEVGTGDNAGVITYIEDAVMANTDKLMIFVNVP